MGSVTLTSLLRFTRRRLLVPAGLAVAVGLTAFSPVFSDPPPQVTAAERALTLGKRRDQVVDVYDRLKPSVVNIHSERTINAPEGDPFNRQPGAGSREESNVLHLGLAYSTEDRDATTDGRGVVSNPAARFRARPEAGLTNRLVDTGNLAFPGTIKRLGLEGAWIHGPLLVQGEYLTVNADPKGKPSFEGSGYYAQGSWVLTGESRPYSKGSIGNVRPMNEYGAFEVALRYSHVDLNDGPVLGGEEDDWTLGANWYLGQHFKLQANYIWASTTKHYGAPINGDADVDPRVFEMRAQIYF